MNIYLKVNTNLLFRLTLPMDNIVLYLFDKWIKKLIF